MNILIRGVLSMLLLFQSVSLSTASTPQDTPKKVEACIPSFDPKTTLEDGTPVKLRISQTVSSE
jgi:hypothetical protein